MKVHSKVSSAVVLGLLLLAVAVASFTDNGNKARAVDGATASRKNPARVAGLGVVEPQSGTIDLAPLMPGVIAAIHVREGDRIRKGDLLVELANEDLKAKLKQAEAVLSIKTSELKRISRPPLPEEIARLESQVREEESAMKLLELQHRRRENLVRAGAVSAEAFNAASSSLAASKERRTIALKNLEILRKGARPEEIESARLEIQLAQQQLAEAQAVLRKSYLHTNIDGVVLRRYKEPGEAILGQSASPIVQIADISKLVVRAQIDEDDIGALKVDQAAEISAVAFADKKFKGRVVRISPRLGAKTVSSGGPTEKRDSRVIDVIIELQSDARLPIDLRVDVVIDVSALKKPESRARSAVDPNENGLRTGRL
ncbi:EmrA Multidrug resistance efflux pump [Rhabdaerophilaceae bacterium]